MSSVEQNRRTPLDQDVIVVAAMKIADELGLESLSMRRLAEALGVTPMALYKHVANREQLINLMVDAVVEKIPPSPNEADWKDSLRNRILGARTLMGRHSWAQDAIESRDLASPAVLSYMDSLMAIMFGAGLSADLVHHAMHALSTRMWGFNRDVLPTPAMPEEPTAREAAYEGFAQDYPAIVRMATTVPNAAAGCDADAEFRFALDLLLEGIDRLHAQGWKSDAHTN